MTSRKSRSAAAAAVVLGSISAVTAELEVPASARLLLARLLFAVPAATPIAGTALCVVDGWEYASRWSTPNNGFVSPSLEDCAMQCQNDAVCTGATYIVSGSEKNCWFKDWGMGAAANPCFPNPNKPLVYQAIIDPATAGGDCASIMYMADTIAEPVYGCDEEMLIEEKPGEVEMVEDMLAPAAVTDLPSTVTDPTELTTLTPAYTAYTGMDYSPTQIPATLVSVVDIGGGLGLIVDSAVECATECTNTPTCNAASYYGDLPFADWPGGDNCYLKTLEGCELPGDAEVTGDATIFLIGGAACGAGAVAPAGALPVAGVAMPGLAPVAAPEQALAPTAVVGFAPVPIAPTVNTTANATAPAAPPLSTDMGVNATSRDFGAAPVEADPLTEPATGSEAGAASSVPSPSVTPSAPSASAGILPGLAAAACAVVGAALLL